MHLEDLLAEISSDLKSLNGDGRQGSRYVGPHATPADAREAAARKSAFATDDYSGAVGRVPVAGGVRALAAGPHRGSWRRPTGRLSFAVRASCGPVGPVVERWGAVRSGGLPAGGSRPGAPNAAAMRVLA